MADGPSIDDPKKTPWKVRTVTQLAKVSIKLLGVNSQLT